MLEKLRSLAAPVLVGALLVVAKPRRHVISKLENGKGGAHPVIIRKLAKALDTDPTELEGE